MIIKTVARGYNMRYHPEEFWDAELYLIPKGAELFDADCVPYYVDYGDGQPLRECYNHYASYEFDTYQTDEPYEETVKYLNEAALEEKARVLKRIEQEDADQKFARRMKESMSKVHRRK